MNENVQGFENIKTERRRVISDVSRIVWPVSVQPWPSFARARIKIKATALERRRSELFRLSTVGRWSDCLRGPYWSGGGSPSAAHENKCWAFWVNGETHWPNNLGPQRIENAPSIIWDNARIRAKSRLVMLTYSSATTPRPFASLLNTRIGLRS